MHTHARKRRTQDGVGPQLLVSSISSMRKDTNPQGIQCDIYLLLLLQVSNVTTLKMCHEHRFVRRLFRYTDTYCDCGCRSNAITKSRLICHCLLISLNPPHPCRRTHDCPCAPRAPTNYARCIHSTGRCSAGCGISSYSMFVCCMPGSLRLLIRQNKFI